MAAREFKGTYNIIKESINSNLNSRTSMHHFVFVFSSLTFILNIWLFLINFYKFLWFSLGKIELKWTERPVTNKTKVYSAAKRRLNGRMYLHLFSHTSDDCPEGRRPGRIRSDMPILALRDEYPPGLSLDRLTQ